MSDAKQIIDRELNHLSLTPAMKASIAGRIRQYEEGNMNKRRKLSTALTVALVAMLLLATLAYAATQSGLLARLFAHTAPTPQAEKLLTPVGISQIDGDCMLTVDEYLLDGSTLYVHWTAHSGADQPLMLLPGAIRAPHYFLSGYGETDGLGRGTALLLGEQVGDMPLKRDYSATSRIDLTDLATLEEPFDVTLTALFMKPVAPIVREADMTDRTASPTIMLLPDYVGYEGFALLLNRFEWRAGGATWFVSQPDGQGRSASPGMGGAQAPEGYEEFLGESGVDYLTAKDYESQGYGQLAAEIALTFTVSPDGANIARAGLEGPMKFSFDAFDLVMDRANFTATGVDIHFTVDDTGKTDLPVADLDFEVRPEGKALGYELSQTKETWAEWPDGRFAMTIQGETPVAAPESITIVPYLQQWDDAQRVMLEDYAMTIPLTGR